jgi:hypothetical protein
MARRAAATAAVTPLRPPRTARPHPIVTPALPVLTMRDLPFPGKIAATDHRHGVLMADDAAKRDRIRLVRPGASSAGAAAMDRRRGTAGPR